MLKMGQDQPGRSNRHEGHEPQHDARTDGELLGIAEHPYQGTDSSQLRSASYSRQLQSASGNAGAGEQEATRQGHVGTDIGVGMGYAEVAGADGEPKGQGNDEDLDERPGIVDGVQAFTEGVHAAREGLG